ncbi:Ig-like domain-containing protein, partial [Mariniflexile soesokkakense]
YNQPPNLGFYFGGGMDTPPSPNIQLVNADCTPTVIVPYIGIDGGALAQVNEVSIEPGSSVTFSPQPDGSGTWSWTGCGASGTSREQTLSPTTSCLATVIHTNDSGCVSFSNFKVNVKENMVHYQFDEAGGTTVSDNSGNGNNGTVSGEATFSPGKIGNAIVLDGVDDYVSVPAGIVDDIDNLTVATWVYWSGGNPWQRIFDFGKSQTENMFLTAGNSNGALQFSITDNGITQNVVGPTLPVNKWSHVAITLDSNSITLYLNGDNVAQYNGGSTINPSDFKPVQNYIGKSQWSDPLFNGRIDDFRIYNYVFSEQEIASLDGVANEPPTVSITSPSEGAQYLIGSDVTINASASDSDGNVNQVEFFVDGESVGIDTTSPYSVNWTIGDGSYSLTAVAADDDLVTTTSTAVGVTGNLLPNTPPTVSITNPTNGSSYDEGTNVPITAVAADVDGSVSQVEFFANGVSIGVDDVSPYSVNWTIGVGGYSLTAVATDNDLSTSTSIAVITTGNATPKLPTVSITSPTDGSSFADGSSVNIEASASDSDGNVVQVEFFVDGASVGIDNTSPYSVNWTIGTGSFSLTAVATDNDDQTTTSAIVNVTGSCSPSSITPYYNVNSTGWATGTDITVNEGDSIQFGPHPTTGGTWSWSGCDTSGPSREQSTISTSSCSATATHTNDCGGVSSVTYNITVTPTSTPEPPTVSITSPTDGSGFANGSSVSIEANASDSDGNVVQVEFFVDGVSVGVDNTSPYSVNWTIGTGSFSLTAVATDNDNQATTSAAVTITGNCSPSTITPYYNVNSTGWFTGTDITVNEGDAIEFGPYPATGGFWSWSGCGTSGSLREQSVALTSSCSATATHTNDCGAVSSVTYNITVTPASTAYMAVNAMETSTVSAGKGQKYGAVSVTVLDDQSYPVSGATVYGTFNGNFGESVSGITDSNGYAYLQTTSTDKGNVTVDFCVDDVTHTSLAYDATQNQITCTGSSAKSSNKKSTNFESEPVEFRLYPNPTSQFITIALGMELVGMNLIDISGRLVQTNAVKTGDKQYQLDMSNLTSGVYLLIVKTSKSQITKRVIKL